MYRKTYIEINTSNLKDNIKNIVDNYRGYKYYIGVVKGNVYGHGYESIKYLIESGINYLATSTLEEAIKIRELYQNIPIMCLQPIHIDDVSIAISNDIAITISDYLYFKNLININLSKGVKFHLKINSGLNRLGISDMNQVLDIINFSKNNSFIKIEGIYSHFATTGIYEKHWDDQLERFRNITSLVDLNEIPMVHLGRSLTLLNHDKIDIVNAVRLGAVMYGYYTTSLKQTGIKAFFREIKRKIYTVLFNISKTNRIIKGKFKSCLSLYSEIIEIKQIKKGEYIGYGSYYQTKSNIYTGIVSIGYADGFLRGNNGGYVFINSKKYKIIAVDMGMLIVTIDNTVKLYDRVEIIGDNISANDLARRNSTTVYEILCAFKESIPRVLK
jgi:alanine racemase